MYNGEERRKEERSILVLSERLKSFMDTTTEYRKSLCAKLDTINVRLNDLPCKSSTEERKGMKSEIGWLQKGAAAIIVSLFGIGVWTGNINTTTNSHEKRLSVIETIETEAQKIRSTNVAKISNLEKIIIQK